MLGERRSDARRRAALPGARPLPDAVEVRGGERRRGAVRRLEQPCLPLGRHGEGASSVLAQGAQHVVDQSARIGADARADLFFDEGFDISAQGDGHGCSFAGDRSAANQGSFALVPELCLGTHLGAKLCFAWRGVQRLARAPPRPRTPLPPETEFRPQGHSQTKFGNEDEQSPRLVSS